jgi:two-component system, NarL family, sensor histidine kinase UhpB
MRRPLVVIFYLCFVIQYPLWSQNNRLIDSLRTLLAKYTSEQAATADLKDTVAVNTLFALSKACWDDDPHTAMEYARQMLELSKAINFKRGMGTANNSIGVIFLNAGDYTQAQKYLAEALRLRIELGGKDAIAASYGNLAILYDLRGNQPEALKNQLIALTIFKETGNRGGIAFSLNNIGIIYEIQKKYPEAIKNYEAAISIREQLGDKRELGGCLHNLGNTYFAMGNNAEALKHILKALKHLEETGDKIGVSDCYHSIANIYTSQGNFDEALKYDFEAMRIKERLGNYDLLESSYSNIGYIYIQKHDLAKAEEYINKALALSKSIPSLELKQDCYRNLWLLDSAKGDFSGALSHFKQYILYRDSLINDENKEKLMQQQMQYEFNNRQAILLAEQDKKDKINEATLMAHKKERMLYIALGVFLLLAVITLWSRLKLARKTRKLIEEKNEQLKVEKDFAEQQRVKAELLDMRHKIAKDLHDDIGSSLSSISIYSEVAQTITGDKMPEATKIINNVGEIAREAMENMNDIVWTINPANDKLDDIMQRLQLISDHLKEARNISVHFDIGDNIREVKLTMNQRKNIYLIFKEAINNIAKYSGADNCFVIIKKQDELILVSIRDDGAGFDRRIQSMGGNGLINMSQRAQEMNGKLEVISGKQSGTEIRFQF